MKKKKKEEPRNGMPSPLRVFTSLREVRQEVLLLLL